MLAIGIDMSKASFHAALNDNSVKKFKNTPEGIDALLVASEALGHSAAETLIGVESTGVYHLLLATRLTKTGYRVMIINPLESHRFGAAHTLRKLKTDAVDAQTVRSMVLFGVGRLFTETDDVLALKALITERESLVEILAIMKRQQEARMVRMRAIERSVHDPSISVIAALQREILLLEAELLAYAPHTQHLLRSIPGIGAISAASLVAYIGDIHRFSTPEKLVAFIGLDCRVHQSGSSINGHGYISKRGSKHLRSMLFNAAFVARRRNPVLGAYFAKKVAEGKHYTSALNAVERKLIHIIWAVWSRGTPFVQRSV
ncbi:MAG: IS110 family transposase [Candidatus Micrarchaeota archaeon]|nr:IS110 family transposase [Candidatus Micrarchaeota archaeon]